uniref:Serine/threonine-protein kinase PLK n=1 Tax=Pogona vitticeps TaxID=103695 RepID=A0ABM5EME3_9SAUR
MGRGKPAWRRRGDREALTRFFLEDPATGTLYKWEQLLGKGAFGRCYKFTDTSTNKVYAVKVIPQSWGSRPDRRGQVEHEAEMHCQLKHRHIVGFHRHFADKENTYLVLEYCSQKSLAHILKARKSLTEPEVRFYLKQVLAGLQYLHCQGIIHRDLKLSNFFVTKNMQVKIGDLGLAIWAEQAGRRQGVVCGTPNYLAPEVIAKKGHSFQSDSWALGCIMYTALTGYSPFEITHQPEMYRCIREGRYPVPGHLSPNARDLIGKLLAPDPAARPSLEEILRHPFFTQGFTPARLSSRACHSTPFFVLPNRLRKFFQKATRLLFGGGPCWESRTASPMPQEAEDVRAPAVPRGPPTETPSLEAGKGEEEEATEEEEEEDPSSVPLRLLMRGSLKDGRSGAGGDTDWSPGGLMETLDHTLRTCLRTIPLANRNPEHQRWPHPVRMVTKWVDYSNKYGFGYLLSDGSTGVLLADGTHLVLCPYHQRVTYCAEAPQVASFPQREVPASLSIKMGILEFFTQYMQRRLLEGGLQPTSPGSSGEELTLRHFAKSDEALLMVFSDGSLQVNFYHDRTKVALSRWGGETLLTFVDGQCQSATFPLDALAREGWAHPLRDRMVYTLHMLHCL